MKTFIFILISISIFSCKKDENTLNDFDLFGRLQSGTGTWEFESLTQKDNSIANSQATNQAATFEFVHFYIRTSFVNSVTVESNHATFYNNNAMQQSRDCEAEKQRIKFDDGNIFGGEVWTVKENKSRKQVWTRTVGNNTSTLTLKKCNCKIPDTAIRETKG